MNQDSAERRAAELNYQTNPPDAQRARGWQFWVGWILSILPSLLLAFSAVMKFMKPPEAAEGFEKLGWSMDLANHLAIIELACTIIYLIPRTAVLGAILLTGYLGGATATHVRVGDPWVIPVVLGVVVWLGIYLRDRRVRDLIPLRS